jgi:hypothetical protein
MKETDVQSAICDYLTLRKVFFLRLNNIPAAFRDRTGALQFRKMGKYARPGLADILVVKDGRAIFLEVKAEKGRQSNDQIVFGSDVIMAGAAYHVCGRLRRCRQLDSGLLARTCFARPSLCTVLHTAVWPTVELGHYSL